jgi:nucleoside-diphosphate-sugar epimerase
VRRLFITGASGFVGRHLLQKLAGLEYEKIFCLSRSGQIPAAGGKIQVLRGSLFDLSSYERELTSVDCVIHLAAVTGKARPSEYFRVNTEGTRFLTGLCQKWGVPRLLYVSSIAVSFPDKRRYFYAQSKEQAEEVVRKSGLRFTILRPTAVLGRGSPTWASLAKLASLPVIPVFGAGRTLVQPIAVDDLVGFLLTVLDSDFFHGETLELGGAEAISIEALLKKISSLRRHKQARTLHLPLFLVVPLLTWLETVAFPLVPVTVGQLSSFRYDGTTKPNPLYPQRSASLKSLDDMLRPLCSDDAL